MKQEPSSGKLHGHTTGNECQLAGKDQVNKSNITVLNSLVYYCLCQERKDKLYCTAGYKTCYEQDYLAVIWFQVRQQKGKAGF
jgi:hypothetical protein